MMTSLDLHDESADDGERRAGDRREGYGPLDPVGLKKHITVQNILMIALLLFQAGQYWDRAQTSTGELAKKLAEVELRLSAAEVASRLSRETDAGVYVRRDVIDERLKAMEQRLAGIERNTAKEGVGR